MSSTDEERMQQPEQQETTAEDMQDVVEQQQQQQQEGEQQQQDEVIEEGVASREDYYQHEQYDDSYFEENDNTREPQQGARATPQLYLGLEFGNHTQRSIDAAIDEAHANSFNFTVVEIASRQPDFISKSAQELPLFAAPLSTSYLLTTSEWSSVVVGKISSLIDLNSEDESTRRRSEQAFNQELSWASHLALPAMLLPTPPVNCSNYARVVYQTLLKLNYMQLWLRVPLSYTEPEAPQAEDCWERWNKFRSLCDHHPSLFAALELGEDLPDNVEKWFGEPVKTLIVPTSLFTANERGMPTLSERHQEVIIDFFKFNIQIIISGESDYPEQGHYPYKRYIDRLYKMSPILTQVEAFEKPYWDYLQAPLQPLMDNLESQTYEVFEKDPVKYNQYEEAMYQALVERKATQSITVLMVVGAGRGPLVKAALKASNRSGQPLRVYAVEKNPNAVVTLHNLHRSLGWGDKVTIVDCDMREWDAPEKADILVSELLGSFGDNELSPECLDGAQRFLKDDGISIPCEYTSYIAPLTSSRLYNEVKAFNDLTHFETAYVVKVHNGIRLAAPQACFKFVHPNPAIIMQQQQKKKSQHESAAAGGTTSQQQSYYPPDNSRYTTMVFRSEDSAMLHGFVGYFDAKLYKDVYISIHPDTHSKDMFSWFPIFFPIRVPIYIPKDSNIEVQFWRNKSKYKVWYEWCVSAPTPIPIHNPNGRSYWIGI